MDIVCRRPGDSPPGEDAQTEGGEPHREEGLSPKSNVQCLGKRMDLLNLIDEIYDVGTSRSHSESLLLQIRNHAPWIEHLTNAEHVCDWAEELAGTTSPYQAIRVLQISLKVGTQFKQNVYERVVFRLAEARQWHLILPVVALGKRKTGRSTVRLLNWRTKALVETQHFTLLDGMLEEFSVSGLRPQRRTFHLIIQGHLLNHDIVRAGDAIQKMEDTGYPVDTTTFAAIISVYKGLGPDSFIKDRAFEILHLDTSASTTVLNGLVMLYLDNHDVDGAFRLLNLPTHPALADAWDLPIGEKDKLRGVDDTSTPVGLFVSAADRTTYLLLINYFAKHQNLSEMHLVLRKMSEAEICPDARVAAALVRAYLASGNENLALAVVLDVCSASRLDMKLLSHIGYRDDTIAPSHGPYEGGPSCELFNSLLQGLLPFRGLEVVPIILHLMNSTGLSPDATTLSVLLAHVERDRNVTPHDVVRVLRPFLSFKVRPTLRHLNTILRSVIRSQKSAVRKEGWDALGALVQRKTVPPKTKKAGLSGALSLPLKDPNLDVTLLHSPSFQEHFKPILDSLSSRSIKADRATFALRMRYETFTRPHGDAVTSAALILQQMKERGLHPNAYHYAALMESHCACGNVGAAQTVFQEAEIRGVLKSRTSQLVLRTILISGYSRMGRPDQALRVFQEMLKADVVPDVAAVHAIVGGFFAVKAFKLARGILLDLWPLIGPLPADLQDASLKELSVKLRELRNGCVTGDRFNPTTEQRQALRRRIDKIIEQWQAMSYQKDVLYPRARLRATGHNRDSPEAPTNPRISLQGEGIDSEEVQT